MILATDYGPLSDVVRYSGLVITVAGAIWLAWRGRANWEPSEEDISKGPQKVGMLVSGIAIVLLFVASLGGTEGGLLSVVAISLGIATILFLIAYGFLTGLLTYNKVESETKTVKVIGGFWLTPKAKQERDARGLTIQRLFAGMRYDPDKVWPRASRQLAKMIFVIGYLGLIVCGTVALASVAFRLGIAVGTEKPGPVTFGLEKIDPGTTLKSFIGNTGPTASYTKPQLRLEGYLVIVDAIVRDERGQTLPVRAKLYLSSGQAVTDLSDPSVPFVAEGPLKPQHVSDGEVVRVWVQQPVSTSGKFYIRITIGNPGGGVLAAHRINFPPFPH